MHLKKLATGICLICFALSCSQTFAQSITVDPSKRYLRDQAGKPFLMVGDAAWSLIAQLSDADADAYLLNRHQMGFNLVLVNLIEHNFASNAPRNFYNQSPFTGTAFSSAPNEAYFAHVDHVIRTAGDLGIVVLLAPVYLGYACGTEGWCTEVKNASTADMQAWGVYLGQRYAISSNIIWIIGGDTDPTPVKTKLRAVVAGIKQYDTTHLFTAHNNGGQMAVDPWPGETWLDINNVYTYTTTQYQECANAYNVSPTKPFFMIESAYENEHSSTQQQLRAQSYWTVLSGGFGHVFGNCPIWHFDASPGWCTPSGWKNQISGQGSQNMLHFHDLFVARNWSALIPDVSHKAVTAGYGTPGQTNYVTAGYCSDSSSIIAYLPTSRTVTVNTSLVGGSAAAAWWFNPSTGASTRISTFAHGSQAFTPPGAGDWVLVVDNEDIFPDTSDPLALDVKEENVFATVQGSVYPNPFKSAVNILTRNASFVEVYDILGRRVFSQKISPGQAIFTWTPRNLGYGVYFLRMGTSARPAKLLYAP